MAPAMSHEPDPARRHLTHLSCRNAGHVLTGAGTASLPPKARPDSGNINGLPWEGSLGHARPLHIADREPLPRSRHSGRLVLFCHMPRDRPTTVIPRTPLVAGPTKSAGQPFDHLYGVLKAQLAPSQPVNTATECWCMPTLMMPSNQPQPTVHLTRHTSVTMAQMPGGHSQ
jgi:hypothetical protein